MGAICNGAMGMQFSSWYSYSMVTIPPYQPWSRLRHGWTVTMGQLPRRKNTQSLGHFTRLGLIMLVHFVSLWWDSRYNTAIELESHLLSWAGRGQSKSYSSAMAACAASARGGTHSTALSASIALATLTTRQALGSRMSTPREPSAPTQPYCHTLWPARITPLPRRPDGE